MQSGEEEIYRYEKYDKGSLRLSSFVFFDLPIQNIKCLTKYC